MKKLHVILVFLNVFCFSTLFAQTVDSLGYTSYSPNALLPSEDSIRAWIQNIEPSFTTIYLDRRSFILYKDPQKKDSVNYKSYRKLLYTGPTKINYKQFAEVANSLWQLNKIDKAEQMLSVIINSNQSYYTKTKYNSSGTAYEYGSFTSNYKNEAALALAKICIQKKQYRRALQYINDAVTKYRIYYTCGTGTMNYNDEIRSLKSLCYESLNMINKGIEYLLPYAFEGSFYSLTDLLKKKYNQQQLNAILEEAERSMMFMRYKDSSTTQVSIYNPGDSINSIETRTYLSAMVIVNLLGKWLNIPEPELKDKEVATKEMFVTVFKESQFYKNLTE